MNAYGRLQDRVQALVEAGTPAPCTNPTTAHRWTSDKPDTRATAATDCGPCLAVAECRAAARHLRVRFGVWAGRDRSRPEEDT